MAKAKIKAEFKDLQIGFNGSGVPLGMRDDIDVLAKIAIDGNDAYLKSLFEVLPEEKELLEASGEKFLAENIPTAEPATEKVEDKTNTTKK